MMVRGIRIVSGILLLGCAHRTVGAAQSVSTRQAVQQVSHAEPAAPENPELTQVKKRFNAKQRQVIYQKLVAAENKARRDARTAIPDPAPDEPEPGRSTAAEDQVVRADAFASEYRHDVAVKYHLTDDQASAVKAEGEARHWRRTH